MKHTKLIIVLAVIIIVTGVPSLVFFTRPPVLVVIDTPYAALYGTARAKRQRIISSLILFRNVKPVLITDAATSDILVIAVNEADKNPFCVIFPRYFSSGAERYHSENPEKITVLLGGFGNTSGLPEADDSLYLYFTDIETDLYRAGLLSGFVTVKKYGATEEETMNIALWQDRIFQDRDREAFSGGVNEIDPELGIIFARSISEMADSKKIYCAVLTSSGSEYLDKNPKIPLILFTWLDPAIAAREVVAIFDDSPWAMVVPAVRMAMEGQAEGLIPSKPFVFSAKTADNGILRTMNSLVKKNAIINQ